MFKTWVFFEETDGFFWIKSSFFRSAKNDKFVVQCVSNPKIFSKYPCYLKCGVVWRKIRNCLYEKRNNFDEERGREREREREKVFCWKKKLSSLEKASLSEWGSKKIAGGCRLSYFLHTPKNLIETCREGEEVSRHWKYFLIEKQSDLVISENRFRNPDYKDWGVTVPDTEPRKVPQSVISLHFKSPISE